MKTIVSQAFLILLLNLTWPAGFTSISQAQQARHGISREEAVYDSLMRRRAGREIDTTSAAIARHVDTIKLLRNWGKLSKGLSQQNVRQLLGSPVMIESDLANAWIIW